MSNQIWISIFVAHIIYHNGNYSKLQPKELRSFFSLANSCGNIFFHFLSILRRSFLVLIFRAARMVWPHILFDYNQHRNRAFQIHAIMIDLYLDLYFLHGVLYIIYHLISCLLLCFYITFFLFELCGVNLHI